MTPTRMIPDRGGAPTFGRRGLDCRRGCKAEQAAIPFNLTGRGKQPASLRLYPYRMVIVLMFASLVGGFATLLTLMPFGWLTALACAPLGGSGLTLAAALLVALVRRDEAFEGSFQEPRADTAALSRSA